MFYQIHFFTVPTGIVLVHLLQERLGGRSKKSRAMTDVGVSFSTLVIRETQWRIQKPLAMSDATTNLSPY